MGFIKKYVFDLPFPISVNNIYKIAVRSRAGNALSYPHIYMTTEAKDLKEEIIWMIKDQTHKQKMPKWKKTHLIFEMEIFNMRDNADTDNLYKILQDSFEESGVVDNDKYFINRTIQRHKTPDKKKWVRIQIYEPKGEPTLQDIQRYFWWMEEY